MKWLSRSSRAISTFSFDTGMSTRRWPAWQALRTRVSMSATGSITLISRPLPAGFAHAGNFPAQRELTETDAAQLELAGRTTAAAAPLAAVVGAHLELRLPLDLLHPRPLRHPASLLVDCDGGFAPEGHPQLAQQRLRGVVPAGRRHERDIHAMDLLDLVVVDLREDHLLLDPHRVVAPAVEAVRWQPTEVAHARDRDRDEPIEKLVHPRAPERHAAAHRHPLAQVEVRDRQLGAHSLRVVLVQARRRRGLGRRTLGLGWRLLLALRGFLALWLVLRLVFRLGRLRLRLAPGLRPGLSRTSLRRFLLFLVR